MEMKAMDFTLTEELDGFAGAITKVSFRQFLGRVEQS
jgi:hypothetical protein